MDDIDRALFEAWGRVKRPDDEADRIAGKSTYARPLRSFALVIRADDKRLFEHCRVHDRGWMELDANSPLCAVDGIELTRAAVEALCLPVAIPYPGVGVDAAARRFGVNRTTIHRWSRQSPGVGAGASRLVDDAINGVKPPRPQGEDGETSTEEWRLRVGERFERREGIIVMDLYMKRSGTNRHRAEKRVWTRSPVFPSGEVFSMPWGGLVRSPRIPLDDSWVQIIDRTHRPLGEKSLMCMFRCSPEVGVPGGPGGCGRWSRKLFLPRPIWTLRDHHAAAGANSRGNSSSAAKFVCHRCAELIYESAERTSRPAPGRRVNTWDRFVKRSSGGALRGRDVEHQ